MQELHELDWADLEATTSLVWQMLHLHYGWPTRETAPALLRSEVVHVVAPERLQRHKPHTIAALVNNKLGAMAKNGRPTS